MTSNHETGTTPTARGRTRRPRAVPWALLSLVLAACGDGPGPTAPPADPCAGPPLPLALGATVPGALEVGLDCLADDGRLFDGFLLSLAQPTLFTVTLATEGYRPFMPLYAAGDTVQLSGWASATEDSLTREHLFPAGSYVLRASSFERAEGTGVPTEGSYALSTRRLERPQEGCARETSVTYGSVAEGRLTEDDCEATREPDDAVLRRSDGYDLLLRPGVPVEVTATADFPFRLAFWANGRPVEVFADIPPGEVRRVTAGGTGFLDFYVLSEEERVGGAYTLTFQEAPAGGAGSTPTPASTAGGEPPRTP